MNIDTSTKIQIAQAARRSKNAAFGCLRGEKTDKGVTAAPTPFIYLIGVGGMGVAIAAIIVAAGGLL